MHAEQPTGRQPKRCTKCGKEKELSAFWFNKRFGRHVAACLDCAAIARAKWSKANSDRVRKTNRAWAKTNPQRVKAAQDRWRNKNPGEAARRTAQWRAANRERALAAQRTSNRKLKDAAYRAYGGYRCQCCGETEEAFLSLDHVNNDGAEHRRQTDRRKLYKWLAKNGYQKSFQVLCMNCNFGKARNGGICPHQSSSASKQTAPGSSCEL
jgi:hypothetical protein